MDTIIKNSHKSYIVSLDPKLENKDRLSEIFMQKMESDLRLENKFLTEESVDSILNSIGITEIKIYYLPFIRCKGYMDVDWSCIEVIKDYDGYYRYIPRTGKSNGDFDLLIPCAYMENIPDSDWCSYMRNYIKFTSIKDYQIENYSGFDTHGCYDYIIHPSSNKPWIESTVADKLQILAKSLSFKLRGETTREQESHKVNFDYILSGEIYYLPYISIKSSYRDENGEWNFLLHPDRYSSSISFVFEFKDVVEALRKKYREEKESKARKEIEDIENLWKARIDKEHTDKVKLVVDKINEINIMREQQNAFFAAVLLFLLLCLIWTIVILSDTHKNWEKFNIPNLLSFFLSFWAISEFLFCMIEEEPFLLKLKEVDKIIKPTPDLIKDVSSAKVKLKYRKIISWIIFITLVASTVIIQISWT